MTITASPGCAITSLIQPISGNAVCTGNYVEQVGLCQFTAINDQFAATCDATGTVCTLTYAGGTSHGLTCDGNTQSYTSAALGIVFTGSCKCTLTGIAAGASSSAPAAAASSAPAAASSSLPPAAGTPASATQPAVATVTVKSSGTTIGKSQGLLIIGFVFSMLVSMA
jgi:hypothetical protein